MAGFMQAKQLQPHHYHSYPTSGQAGPTPKRMETKCSAPSTVDSTSSLSSMEDDVLKKKLAKNRAELKAAKRRISVVSKEKEGLEQELAMKNKKLKSVMAAKDIFLNFNVDKTLYADVMGGGAATPADGKKQSVDDAQSSSSSSQKSGSRRRLRSSSGSMDSTSSKMEEGEEMEGVAIIKDQVSAAEFVSRMKEHLEGSGRQDVVVISSYQEEEGPAEGKEGGSSSSSRRLNFHLDFWRTAVPIILKDDVFQAEPMPDFLNGLANEHGPEAVCSMLRDACLLNCQKPRGCVDAFKEDPLSDVEEDNDAGSTAIGRRAGPTSLVSTTGPSRGGPMVPRRGGVTLTRIRPLLPELVGEGKM